MQKQNGLTLIELMVTLAVLVVMTSLAVPGFSAYVDNNRRTIDVNELVISLNLARSEAVKRANTVIVCSRGINTTCANDGSGLWNNGWLVYIDTDGSGNANGNELLEVHGSLTPNISFGDTEGNADDSISYQANGFSSSTATFKRCDSRGAADARAVIVSPTGRIRMSRDNNDPDTTHEDRLGVNLTCP